MKASILHIKLCRKIKNIYLVLIILLKNLYVTKIIFLSKYYVYFSYKSLFVSFFSLSEELRLLWKYPQIFEFFLKYSSWGKLKFEWWRRLESGQGDLREKLRFECEGQVEWSWWRRGQVSPFPCNSTEYIINYKFCFYFIDDVCFLLSIFKS